MPQLKTWNGSAWVVPKAVKTWDGSQWVERSKLKYWNGSAWAEAGLAPSNYVIKDGKFVNGFAPVLYATNSSGATHGYDSVMQAYRLNISDGESYIQVRTNKNFTKGSYTKMFARTSYGWESDGGYGTVACVTPLPSNVVGFYGLIEVNMSSPGGFTLKSVNIANNFSEYSVLLEAFSYEGSFFTLYVRDLYFE